MSGVDVEDVFESDSSDNEENHSKLLNSVAQLDSTQRVKPAQRKEIATEVSEYNLDQGPSGKKNLINVKELVKVLGKNSGHGVITKKITSVTEKAKTLPKPLEKQAEERLKRSIGFEKVKEQLGKWDAIVARNALKDSISFPLNDNTMKKPKSNEFLSQFKTKTPLEEEIAIVLKQDNIKDNESEDDEFPLTLEEMMEKRKEMAQIRAKLSYKQTKAQRQSKIKSKKYHRLLKREKIRQQLKEFELLQKTDPEAALKKLSELDKSRAQERASLRHRNTGQWAKNLTVKAKYDVETRKILAEQLKISRELTQKVSQIKSSDDDDDDEESENQIVPDTVHLPEPKRNISSTENPWVLDVAKEVQDFVSGYKKFWDEKGKEINESKFDLPENKFVNENKVTENVKTTKNDISSEIKKVSKSQIVSEPEVIFKVKSPKNSKDRPKKKQYVSIFPASGVWVVTPVIDESNCKTNNKRKANDIDTLFDELNDELMKRATIKLDKMKKNLEKSEKQKNQVKGNELTAKEFDLSLKHKIIVDRPDMDVGLLEGEIEDNVPQNLIKTGLTDSGSKAPPVIDPKNFIQVKPKRLRSHLPENITGQEDALDDEKAQQMVIEEAFADDDVMAEFKEMKEDEEKSSKVEIETTLPGWGEWGGTGIEPNPRKKKRLVLNLPPRKDKNKKDIIINEKENPNLKNHLVKEVPHPFESVDAFEANIRAPVGRDWVPETAHQKLIQKQVLTKLGTVIEPMDENEIVRLKKASKSPYQGKKKKKSIKE